MMGYPGAGKTTTAKIIHELTGAEHVSSDLTRLKLFPQPSFSQNEHDQLYRHIDREIENLLSEGKDVIYDANLNRYRHRQEKYTICQRTNANPILIWVQTPKELAKSRVLDPGRVHLVPHNESAHEMFDRISKIIEPPRPNEPHLTVDGTKVSPEYVSGILGL